MILLGLVDHQRPAIVGLLAVPYIGCTYIEFSDPSPGTSAGDLSDAGPAAGDAIDSMASDADAPPGDADPNLNGGVDDAAALDDAAVPVGITRTR